MLFTPLFYPLTDQMKMQREKIKKKVGTRINFKFYFPFLSTTLIAMNTKLLHYLLNLVYHKTSYRTSHKTSYRTSHKAGAFLTDILEEVNGPLLNQISEQKLWCVKNFIKSFNRGLVCLRAHIIVMSNVFWDTLWCTLCTMIHIFDFSSWVHYNWVHSIVGYTLYSWVHTL